MLPPDDPEQLEEEPRRRTPPKTTSGASKRAASRSKKAIQAEEVTSTLASGLVVAGVGIGQFLPTTGYVCADQADYGASAIVAIAMKYPKAWDYLTKASDMAPWFRAGRFVGAVTVAVAVDIGSLPPDHIIASRLGVEAAYLATHEEPPPQETPTTAGGFPPNVANPFTAAMV